jgi:hypothetical protein
MTPESEGVASWFYCLVRASRGRANLEGIAKKVDEGVWVVEEESFGLGRQFAGRLDFRFAQTSVEGARYHCWFLEAWAGPSRC